MLEYLTLLNRLHCCTALVLSLAIAKVKNDLSQSHLAITYHYDVRYIRLFNINVIDDSEREHNLKSQNDQQTSQTQCFIINRDEIKQNMQ